jgi:hypothetical protein
MSLPNPSFKPVGRLSLQLQGLENGNKTPATGPPISRFMMVAIFYEGLKQQQLIATALRIGIVYGAYHSVVGREAQ